MRSLLLALALLGCADDQRMTPVAYESPPPPPPPPIRFDTAEVEEIPHCGNCSPEFIVTFPNGRQFRGYELFFYAREYRWWSYPDGHYLFDERRDYERELDAAMTRRKWSVTK